VHQQVVESGVPRDVLMQRVQRYAGEIVPAFNAYVYFRVGYWLAKTFAQMAYRVRLGYTDEAALAAIQPSSTVVFVMNHRSNMDYVLVSFLAAPIIRGLVVLVRAVARRLETLLQRSRFRMQRHWRIEAAALIDALPLFEDLPVDILNDIAGRVERHQFGAGTTVVRQGDPATAMYVVRSGILDVIEEDADGSQRVVQTLSAGESFGVIGLVSGAPRNATVRTRRRAELFTIDKGTFDRLLTDHVALPEFAPTLYELAALRALPPFANVPSEELLRLREHGSWLNVPPGTAVVEQGAVGDAFFAVGDGQFEVVVDGQRVGTCEPGGHFGELALLSDAPRAATVRSITPARVFRLDRAGFEQLVAGAFRDRVDAATHRVAFQRE